MADSNSDQLRDLLDRLGLEVSSGDHHAHMGAALKRMLTVFEWETAFEFWTFTLKAHFEAAVLGLTRLFDNDPQTVTLKKLLLMMESHAGQFVEMNAADVRNQLIPSVRNETKNIRTTVEPLKKIRDQMLAHNALHKTLSDRDWNIAWADLVVAYSHVLKLVRGVYKAYKGHNSTLAIGAKKTTISKELRNVLARGQ